jgi:hypothetical protein
MPHENGDMKISSLPLIGARRKAPGEPIYLVSTAGHPNYGDEVIARAWLDYLAMRHPDREVWLDCPHPGRASHLFMGRHPRLRVTDTLWELAMGNPTHDPIADEDRIRGLVRDLGSPRFDAGLVALRTVGSIHLLGGGFLNAIWQDNLGLISAMLELHESFGVRLIATGQGLMPLSAAQAAWVGRAFSTFDAVEVRDAESAAIVQTEVGLDDAFLALALPRPVFDERPAPERMLLVQGDLRAWDDEAARATIRAFTAGARDVGLVEAIPPDDVRYAGASESEERVYAFGHIWKDGLPAAADQRWLTSRFHAHLLAAAAGAAGLVIQGAPGYYDIKHASLLALGTGWTPVTAGDQATAADATAERGFPAHARHLAARKLRLADRLYPHR